ncbi:transposase [Aeribacillus pallidus]|nr:transposase [Aeribacillus pallidus]MED4485290.1 transposase [Aeribacillus pallidus]
MYKQYTTEFKLEVLLAYENRECTIQELCKRYQIDSPLFILLLQQAAIA